MVFNLVSEKVPIKQASAFDLFGVINDEVIFMRFSIILNVYVKICIFRIVIAIS